MTQYGELSRDDMHRTTVEDGMLVPMDDEVAEEHPHVDGEDVKLFMEKEIKETKLIVGESYDHAFLTEGTCIIASKPKVGKSYFVMTMALAVAGGHDFIGYKTNQCNVLYFDYETNEYTRQRRLKNILEANGWEAPEGKLTFSTSKARVGHGFEDMLAEYLTEHPDTGLVIIDMYQQVVDEKKSAKENDYEQAYRNFDALNELARWFSVAIVLVMHSRKEINQDDPFSNILGSVGLQGATDQMLTLGRRGLDGPIRIWGKAKTHDSSPMLTMKHEKSLWTVVDDSEWDGYQERADNDAEYMGSDIRTAVIRIAKDQGFWRGRASELRSVAQDYGIGIGETPKLIGGFLHRYDGMFLKKDNIRVKIVKNGSGSKQYEISDGELPEGFEKSPLMELPF